MNKKDKTKPEGKWEFDGEVAASFEDMLGRSIPQYEVMRESVFEVACKFVRQGEDIVDLGCSRGDALAPLLAEYGAHNRFTGVEVSKPMLKIARRRFKGFIDTSVVQIKNLDLRKQYPNVDACVTLCVLTLQFTPIEYRQQILQNIYDSTLPGGALIIVEKVLGSNAVLDALMVEKYYGLKEKNGYTKTDIARKRMSLEGVLVPVTAKWNEELLSMAGFRSVDCFWRWMNFAAWVAIK